MNNNFSDRFMMIINWIIENTDKIEKIKKLKEEEMKKMDNDDSYNSTEMNLIINHNNFLRIDAENDIWVRFYSFDKEDEGGKDKKSVIQSVRKITISIRSKKLSVTKLKKYIDNETQKYIEKIDEKNLNKTFFFEYLKEDEEYGRPHFSQIEFNTNRKLKNVFFDQKDEFMKKFNFFMNNKDWYDEHGIPYHLGILLHGFPGCGKTSLIKAIAKETGYQIISIPLGRIKKAKDLNNIFYSEKINRNKIPMTKRIYLFEDIDAMDVSLKRDDDNVSIASDIEELPDEADLKEEAIQVKKDEDATLLAKLIKAESNKITTCMKDDDPLTLSHLLNIIDGMIEMPGRIIILTTNHINKLDPALIREGRIDIKVEMKKASRNIVKQMFNWFYKKELDNDILQKIPDMHFTPAKISNIFYKNHDNSEMAISELISN